MQRSRTHSDPVTHVVRAYVLARDGGCVARRLLGAEHVCRDRFGNVHHAQFVDRLTLDHVKSEPRMGKRAESDAQHLVSLCWASHLGGWATSHRPELREYLRRFA